MKIPAIINITELAHLYFERIGSPSKNRKTSQVRFRQQKHKINEKVVKSIIKEKLKAFTK